MPKHESLGTRRGQYFAGDKPSLFDELRRNRRPKEVKNLRVEGSADAAICAIRPNLNAARGIAKRGERGKCQQICHRSWNVAQGWTDQPLVR